MRRGLLALGFGGLVLFAACKDPPNHPPVGGEGNGPIGSVVGGGGTSSGSVGDAGGDASLDGGTCADLDITGAAIDVLSVADDPPPAIGGTLTDGTYEITDAKLYAGIGSLPGPTGTTYQGSIQITGTSYERILVFHGANGAVQSTNVSGSILVGSLTGTATLSLVCPAISQEQVAYSVTGDTITITDQTTRVGFVYAKKL